MSTSILPLCILSEKHERSSRCAVRQASNEIDCCRYLTKHSLLFLPGAIEIVSRECSYRIYNAYRRKPQPTKIWHPIFRPIGRAFASCGMRIFLTVLQFGPFCSLLLSERKKCYFFLARSLVEITRISHVKRKQFCQQRITAETSRDARTYVHFSAYPLK